MVVMNICSVVSLVGMAAHEYRIGYIFPIPPHTPMHNDLITWILQEFVCVYFLQSQGCKDDLKAPGSAQSHYTQV